MSYPNAANIKALKQYNQVDVHTGIDSASPHKLIQMLLDGALARIAHAKGHMKAKKPAQKGENIVMAISIIGGLRDSLDHEQGGSLASNLDSLYEYMTHQLMEANINDNVSVLDEVHNLLTEIKSAWDEIADHPAAKAQAQIEPAA